MGQRKIHNTPWLALNATAQTRQGRCAHWCKSGMKVMEITNHFGVGFEDYSSGGNSCLVLTVNIVKAQGIKVLAGTLLLSCCYMDTCYQSVF